MKYKYTVESKTNPNLVYAGVILIVINVILKFSGIRDFDYENLSKDDMIVELIILATGLVFSIWAYRVAIKLNRSGLFWAIVTFFFTPISLIILGTRDINIKIELRKIFNKYKSDFFLEKLKLEKDYKSGKIDDTILREKINKARERYNELMNNELQNAELRLEEKHKEVIVEKVVGNGRAVNVKGKCPACDTKLPADVDECPECGLNFRY